MPYVPREPNKKLILTGIFVAVFFVAAAITFCINRFVIKGNLVLKEPMVLLLIGLNMDLAAPQPQDNPKELPRAGTLALTFIHPAKHRISLVSIPGDSLADIPGHGLDRIDHASVLGGYDLTKKAVAELTGIQVTRYAAVDFDGFIKLIDLLGGVEINMGQGMRFTDEYGKFDLAPGRQVLNGTEALQYVRFRNGSGDIGRVERQKVLLHAVYEKAMQPDSIMKLPRLTELAKKYIITDLTTPEMIRVAGFARQVNKEIRFQSYTLPGKFYETYWQPDPARVYKLMSRLKPAAAKN
jgi:LCP family protein required for cell wall assembly